MHTTCTMGGGGGCDILLMFIGSTVLREALGHKSESEKTMFRNLQYGLRKQGLNDICSISEYNLKDFNSNKRLNLESLAVKYGQLN